MKYRPKATTNQSLFLSSSARAAADSFVQHSATVNMVCRRRRPLDLGQHVHLQRRSNLLLGAVPPKPRLKHLLYVLQPVPAISGRLQLFANLRFRKMQVCQAQWYESADKQAELVQSVAWASLHPAKGFVGAQAMDWTTRVVERI